MASSAPPADPAALEIRLLGGFRLLAGSEPVILPRSRGARALLAYLAATGRSQSGDHLRALLWEGAADPQAGLDAALREIGALVAGGKFRLHLDGGGAALDL